MDHELHDRLADALIGIDDATLRRSFADTIALDESRSALDDVQRSLRAVTGLRPGDEGLRWFLRSWSMTNNSAMCVSGLGNRLSLELRESPSPRVVEALVSLHRIADEDLGVGNALLHADLFYAMATSLCGGDEWQGRRYLTPEAVAFKRWKDHRCLIDDDLVVGLLSTVVHEVYTHAEVELLQPLFDGWLASCGWDAAERDRTLTWVKVHCGGTELEHFGHAVDALFAYTGDGERGADRVGPIVLAYLRHKAAAMTSIVEQFGAVDTVAIVG